MRQNSLTMYRVGGVFLKFLASWMVFLVAATYAFHEYMLQQNVGAGRLFAGLPDNSHSSPPLLHPAVTQALSIIQREKSIMLVCVIFLKLTSFRLSYFFAENKIFNKIEKRTRNMFQQWVGWKS